MSRGEMFQEFEEKRRKEGFFPQVYKGVCAAMGEENIDKLVNKLTSNLFGVYAFLFAGDLAR